MAFQADLPFADFLRGVAKADFTVNSAPAVNFLLEENLNNSREAEFLAISLVSTSLTWSSTVWLNSYANYFSEKIDRPRRNAQSIGTFNALNRDNHPARESNQEVVRIESIPNLRRSYSSYFDSVDDLAKDLADLCQANKPNQSYLLDGDRRSRLTLWLEGLNQSRNARPAFAAPLDEVESLLCLPDWATQMRNRLGLSHFSGSAANPLPVVLCQYNLTRAERAARAARVAAWTAIPTVLEAGSRRGPGAAFFPFPQAAAARFHSLGYGATVNLDLTTDPRSDFNSELLHFPIDYTLGDFVLVGEIVDEITDDHLMQARQRHFAFLDADLRYRNDVI